jgi:uncharacterized protein
LKEDYDGAEPSASSVSALNTLTLSHLTGDTVLLSKAERTLARYGPRIGAAGRTIPMMLCALSAWHAGYSQVVIVGDPNTRQPLMTEVAHHYLPFSIIIPAPVTGSRDELSKLLPFTAAMTAQTESLVYVCRDFACRQPVGTAAELAEELRTTKS